MMHKDKKRMFIIGILFIIFIIIVILIISALTKYAKKKDTEPQVSDPYPIEYVYMGIQYDMENEYQVIVPLDANFNKSDYKVKSFYEIKDVKANNKKLRIYSDAINEVAYKKESNEFYLSEINSFYDQTTTVKLADDYIVLLSSDGTLKYMSYNTISSEEKIVIANQLDSQTIAVINNTVYYRDMDGIMSYNLANKTNKIEVPVEENFSPYIEDNNNNYILLKSNDEYIIYGINNKKTSYIKDITNSEMLSFYDLGIVYAESSPYKLTSYNLFYQMYEGGAYRVEDGWTVDHMYLINDSNCYMDLVNSDNEHKYYIFDSVKLEIVATLEEPFEKIIKVQ